MTKHHKKMSSTEDLRREAEKRLNLARKNNGPQEDVQRLVQELQIHQVELEMQNEELLRSNYEAELFSSKYADLFDFAPVALFIVDTLGVIKEVNLAASQFLGDSKQKIINNRFQAFIHPSYTDSFYFFNQHVIRNESKQSLELRMSKTTGAPAYVILECRKLQSEKNQEVEMLIAVVDITERKNAAEALLKAHRELEEKVKERTKELEESNLALRLTSEEKQKHANKIFDLNAALIESEKKLLELNESKDKFFAIIAHDLRSPFAGLMGYSKLLAAKAETLTREEIVLFANNIHIYASNFEKLVNDLLSWSHLQIGHYVCEPKPLKVCDIINETLHIFSVNAAEKGIELVSNCQLCPIIYADEKMIRSIFRNLVSNAIKFTYKGGRIEICTEDKGSEVEVTVSDTGTGLTDRIKKRLFKIDQQAISVGTANEKGNGLGLILVKEFVEKHNGRIWVESEVGKGSKFYFTLPKQ